MEFFLRGLIIGFSIAAPVGPIGLLCISRTLSGGMTAGLVSGLGAASADAVYGSIAGFGLTFIREIFLSYSEWLRLAGGIFLILLGIRIFFRSPPQGGGESGNGGLAIAYSTTFLLTLTNPLTILSFMAIFAGMGLAGSQGNYYSAGALVGGVFLGSGLWWLVLSSAAGLLRERFQRRWLSPIHRVMGVIIAGAGLWSLTAM